MTIRKSGGKSRVEETDEILTFSLTDEFLHLGHRVAQFRVCDLYVSLEIVEHPEVDGRMMSTSTDGEN